MTRPYDFLTEATVPAVGDASAVPPRPRYRAGTPTMLDKARQILDDDTHPQRTLLVDLLATAIALDPPDDYVESDPTPPYGIRRPLRLLKWQLP